MRWVRLAFGPVADAPDPRTVTSAVGVDADGPRPTPFAVPRGGDRPRRERVDHFMFYETWTSRALWQAHMAAPHLAACLEATKGALLEFTLNEMTHIA